MSDTVILERHAGGVATLTLNRPQRLNALTLPMIYEEIPDAIREVGEDAEIGVLVITGAGQGFCAGADLESGAFEVGDELVLHMERSYRTPWALHELAKPTIAAVNGAAVGAGLGLALTCDVRLAAPAAKFVAPYIRMGMTPDFGLTWSLPRAVGPAAALQLFLDGSPILADEALRVGLISAIHDDPLAAAMEMAERWGASPLAARLTKACVLESIDGTMRDALFTTEIAAECAAMGSEEFAQRFVRYRDAIRGRG